MPLDVAEATLTATFRHEIDYTADSGCDVDWANQAEGGAVLDTIATGTQDGAYNLVVVLETPGYAETRFWAGNAQRLMKLGQPGSHREATNRTEELEEEV